MSLSVQWYDAFGFHTAAQLERKVEGFFSNFVARSDPTVSSEGQQRDVREAMDDIRRFLAGENGEEGWPLQGWTPLIRSIAGENGEEGWPNLNHGKNIITILGYIPGIATIVAIVKFYFIYEIQNTIANEELIDVLPVIHGYLNGQKIRTVIEITSFGVLLLIPDIIFTIGRMLSD